ncbi:MAG: LamG domain-containing protein, partial [Phycisphaerales bacterium]
MSKKLILIAVVLMVVPAYAVENFRVSDYGAGVQIWFEVEDFDERDPPGDQYFPLVDEAGAFGRAMMRAGGSGGMVRYTFNISSAGGSGGTWYFWGRVINPSNNSDYMLVEGDPGDLVIPTGPPYPGGDETAPFDNGDDRIFEQDAGSAGNWAWSRADHSEGHTKELRDGENTMYIFHRQGNDSKIMDVFMWTDDPGYTPTDADYEDALPGKPSPYALRPDPKDGAMISSTWVSATWKPGAYAVSHNVYLGENFDEVNDGTVDSPVFQGNQTSDNFIAGFFGFPFPEGLVPGTTYYWRIDEVNDADPNSPWKGDVWSFWIPPTSAYDPSPSDGARYVDLDTTLTWQPGLDAKIHNIVFGDNFDEVNSAPAGSPLGGATFTPAALEADKTYYWRVDELNPPTTVKGEVWSFTTMPDIPVTDPNLVAWYKFEVGAGHRIIDFSGHGNDGDVMGNVLWVPGQFNLGLEFLGDNIGHVELPAGMVNTTSGSIMMWVNTDLTGNEGMFWYGTETGGDGFGDENEIHIHNQDAGTLGFGIEGATDVRLDGPMLAGAGWNHVAATWDTVDGCTLYFNGAEVDFQAHTANIADLSTIRLGRPVGTGNGNRYHDGLLDDVRLFDYAITADQVNEIMTKGEDPSRAGGPNPRNGAIAAINVATPLTWSAGEGASQHDVFFGTDKAAVVDADASDTTGVYVGRQNATSYTPPGITMGSGPFYWRIDEVANDGSIVTGGVWTFSVADYALV